MSPVGLGVGAMATGLALLVATPLAPVAARLPVEPKVRSPHPKLPAGVRLWAGPAVGAVAAGAVAPVLAPLVIAGVALRRHLRSLHERRAALVATARNLPTAVDLLGLCISAGMTLPLAHAHLDGRLTGPIGQALTQASQSARAGRSRADALLTSLTPLGDDAAALARLLADHLRYGTPLAPGLARASMELRLAQRRRAEESARKIPVRLLGPLVTCVLPAFGLLTVVPLLAASLQSLPL